VRQKEKGKTRKEKGKKEEPAGNPLSFSPFAFFL
jgi:hypothetical protein